MPVIIQCLQSVEHLPQQIGPYIQIYANRSLVLGPKELMQVQFPYCIMGNQLQVHDVLASKYLKLHLKLRTNGQIWCIIENLTEHVQTVTPRQKMIAMQGQMILLKDIDGRETKPSVLLTDTVGDRTRIVQKYEQVFDEEWRDLTPQMQQLAVQENDLLKTQDISWSSSVQWQPISLVQQEEMEEELQSL